MDADLFMAAEDVYELLSNYDQCLINYSDSCHCAYYTNYINVLCKITYFYALVGNRSYEALNKLFQAVSPLCLTWNNVYIYKVRKDHITYGMLCVCGTRWSFPVIMTGVQHGMQSTASYYGIRPVITLKAYEVHNSSVCDFYASFNVGYVM